jgi:hypothetical protein
MLWTDYVKQHNEVVKDYRDECITFDDMNCYLDDLYREYKQGMDWTNYWCEFWNEVRICTDDGNPTITEDYHNYIATVESWPEPEYKDIIQAPSLPEIWIKK